jgi:hypothetical protein
MIESARFKTAIVRQAYEYWLGKCVRGRLPGRADLRPEELRAALPYIFLVDVTRDPLGFRFRLVGTRITEWAGQEFTGVAVDEPAYGAQWRRVFDTYAAVVESRRPQLDIWDAPWASREFVRYERLIAPLSSDGQTIDMLFGALYAFAEDAGSGSVV